MVAKAPEVEEEDKDFALRLGPLRTVVLTSPPWGVLQDDDHDKRLTSENIKVCVVALGFLLVCCCSICECS